MCRFLLICFLLYTRTSLAQPPGNAQLANPEKNITRHQFVFDKKTGLISLPPDSSSGPEAIIEHLLKTCARQNIRTIFLGDCEHGSYAKDEIIINSMPYFKKNGFALAIENDEDLLLRTIGMPFKLVTAEQIRQNRQKLITEIEQILNVRTNYKEQAISLYNMIYKAKENGTDLFFCELSEFTDLHTSTVTSFLNSYNQEIKDQFNLSNSGDSNTRIKAKSQYRLLTDRQLFLFYAKNFAILRARDSIIQIPKVPTVIYRGTGHFYGANDLDEDKKYGNSVTIWNIATPDSIGFDIFNTFKIKKEELKKLTIALNDSAVTNTALKNQVKTYRSLIKPLQNQEFDLPDYLLINDRPGSNPKMYETITFLKTHHFSQKNGIDICETSDSSIYDNLVKDKIIARRDPPDSAPKSGSQITISKTNTLP